LLIKADGEVLFASPQLCKTIRSLPADITGKNLFDLSFTQPDKLRTYLENCARSKQMVMGSLELSVKETGERLEFPMRRGCDIYR
jgi:hypothetical protein